MKDVRPEDIAGRQNGLVARWQLQRSGMSAKAVRCWAAGLRAVHEGVYVTGWAPIGERELWWAAVLTAPGTVLSHASAAALWGIRTPIGNGQTVTRVGARGRQTEPGLLVSYSLTLDHQVVNVHGLPVTTVERTVIDLWPHLSPRARSRVLREAFRLKVTTGPRMLAAIRRHRGRRGVATLRVEVQALSELALDRCKSDAEAWAVALIADARRAMPLVNAEIAGREADLAWPAHRLIVELDGPQFHVLRDADISKQRAWETAGYSVRRLSTDALYADPESLLALVPNVPSAPL
jgi:very-short-patch-repair endonuclease